MSNAVRIPITAINLHGDEQGNGRSWSYGRRYFEGQGLGVGDTWVAHEYIAWISTMHSAFRQPRGVPDFRGYNQQEQKEFDAWLLASSARCGSTCACEWEKWIATEQRELTDEREHKEDL